MQFIVECIFELLFEGIFVASTNKKVSRLIRYPLIALIIIIFAFMCTLFMFIGVSVIKDNIIGGILIILLSLFFTIASILNFKKVYLKKQKINKKK